MRKADAISMVNVLCWKMGLPSVPVNWQERTRDAGAHYTPPKKGFPLGWVYLNNKQDEWVVVHEVAHYVVQQRAPKYSKRERRQFSGLRGRRFTRGVAHGPVFVETLKEVAAIWYGDFRRYPWKNEYKTLRHHGEQ